MRTSCVSLTVLILAAIVHFVPTRSAHATSPPPPGSGWLEESRSTEMQLFGAVLGIEALGILPNLHRGRTPGSRAARAILGTVTGAIGIGYGLSSNAMRPSTLSPACGLSCAALGVGTLILVHRQRIPDPPAGRVGTIIEAGLWQGEPGVVGLAVRLRY